MSTPKRNRPLGQLSKLLFQWRTLAVFLIAIGVTVIVFYGLRTQRSYREFQHIRADRTDPGTTRVKAIRPWMTVRYVGVAYAVPEEYIFAELEIPYNRRNSNETLRRLNDEYALGNSPNGDYPLIIDHVAQAIIEYRADPISTEQFEIRSWMTIRYIANSTGVPEIYLFEQLGLDTQEATEIDAAVRPLDQLGPLLNPSGGAEAFFEVLRTAIARYEPEQP